MKASERYAKAAELRAAGMTFRQIGQELGGVSATRAREMHDSHKRRELYPRNNKVTEGLNTRAAIALGTLNFESKEAVLEAYKAGKFDPVLRGESKGGQLANIGIKTLREIEAWLGVEPRRLEKKQASKETLARAKNMLERYGYKVEKPPSD